MLCLGTDLLSEDQIRNIVQIFLSSSMMQNDRHLQRLAKVTKMERKGEHAPSPLQGEGWGEGRGVQTRQSSLL